MPGLELDDADLQRLFVERIAPVLFVDQPTDRPVLGFLIGQPGAGVVRAASFVAERETTPIIGATELRAFHPHFAELSRRPARASLETLATTAATWIRDSMRYARTAQRSLVLDASSTPPSLVLATAKTFAEAGFEVRAVAVGAPRAESLLSVASKYLLNVRAERIATFTDLAAHDRGFADVEQLVGELSTSPHVDQLTIVDNNGQVTFNAHRTDEGGYSGASAGVNAARRLEQSPGAALRWLSELRACTDFALNAERMPAPVGELLIDLHETALREVVPAVRLPRDSEALPRLEATLASRLVGLRRATTDQRPRVPEPSGPVISAPGTDRGISR